MGEILNIRILGTQILGFLIVLWVLWKVAWKPVLEMLEARRQKIAGDVDSAKKLREDAEKLKAEYEEHLRTIEAESRARIQQAVKEGQKVADEIRAKAEQERRKATEQAKEELALEYKKARAALREDMVRLSLGAARELLRKELDEAEHRRLVDEFLTDLSRQETS